jgi:ribosomal protein S27AE
VADDLSDLLDDAVPKCPRCLTLLDVEGDGLVLAWLECPVCGDLFL